MKKLILSILTFGSLLNVSAQALKTTTAITVPTVAMLPSMDVYAAIPVHDCGWGLGFNLLSSPLKIFELDPQTPIQIRFGGEFYMAELNHRRLGRVPLVAPQEGDAKIRLSELAYGLNGMTRISLPYSKRITPYVDIFGGLRGFAANMNITPMQKQNGYEESTSKNLSSNVNLNYGLTLGMLVSLGEYVKFNAGIMYTRSDVRVEMVNIKGARVDGGSIITDKKLTANDLVIAKIGFTFLIDGGDCSCSSRSTGCGGGGGALFSNLGGGLKNSVNFNVLPSR